MFNSLVKLFPNPYILLYILLTAIPFYTFRGPKPKTEKGKRKLSNKRKNFQGKDHLNYKKMKIKGRHINNKI